MQDQLLLSSASSKNSNDISEKPTLKNSFISKNPNTTTTNISDLPSNSGECSLVANTANSQEEEYVLPSNIKFKTNTEQNFLITNEDAQQNGATNLAQIFPASQDILPRTNDNVSFLIQC